MSDPISDLLTRIRNASTAQHKYVEVRWSKFKEAIVEILKEEGFVEDYFVKGQDSGNRMRIRLKYGRGRDPVIKGIVRQSRPGKRYFVKSEEIQPVRGKMGVSIFSTSKGVMTGLNARRNNVGGELLCKVW
ncbi:MAG: 30S ribosomal protein S8 [Waddliaceae bacterium]|nr:30S ribosomal protein S8 [Waddliaceae bacterium]